MATQKKVSKQHFQARVVMWVGIFLLPVIIALSFLVIWVDDWWEANKDGAARNSFDSIVIDGGVLYTVPNTDVQIFLPDGWIVDYIPSEEACGPGLFAMDTASVTRDGWVNALTIAALQNFQHKTVKDISPDNMDIDDYIAETRRGPGRVIVLEGEHRSMVYRFGISTVSGLGAAALGPVDPDDIKIILNGRPDQSL